MPAEEPEMSQAALHTWLQKKVGDRAIETIENNCLIEWQCRKSW